MKILGYDLITFVFMACVFIGAGVLFGIMVNISIGKKFYNPGGIVGGVISGILMLFL